MTDPRGVWVLGTQPPLPDILFLQFSQGNLRKYWPNN